MDLEAETGTVRVETVRRALQNRPRDFPVKGGRGALGEGEAGIGGGEGGGTAAFMAQPRGKKAKEAGPTSSNCLEDDGSEEESHARATMEEGFARLRVLEYRARVPVSFGPSGGAKGATDGGIPSFGTPCGTQISAGRQRSRPEGSGGVEGCAVDHILYGVVAADTVTRAQAREGVISPAVLSLPAEWAD